MEQNSKVEEPIAISKIASRYLLFDINIVTHLRRNHHIIGVLTGTIPTCPQQNIFTGLPVELLPEEVRVLVMKGIAYIVDDLAFHKQRFSSFEGEEKRLYLRSLRSEGLKAQRLAEGRSAASTERHLARKAVMRASENSSSTSSPVTVRNVNNNTNTTDQESLFDGGRPASPAPSNSSLSTIALSKPQAITFSTTYPPLTVPSKSDDLSLPNVSVSFPLFAHLHEKGYFMSPGLRFGCHYSVYPGDPLRYHAHFLGVGYDWNQEIPLLDIVGGGRLGTGVKKGFLMGGRDPSKKDDDHSNVRTFCVEWGGM